MEEISMHILDIVMNSIEADATIIEIFIEDSIKNNFLKINIKDNGKGMADEILDKVVNSFYTTRTTRNVGLGIPMFKQACERCNGYFKINSKVGVGTNIECSFERNNIDRAPLGNIGETIMVIINSGNNFELTYTHKTDEDIFDFSTREVKKILDGMNIRENSILLWIKEFINENVKDK